MSERRFDLRLKRFDRFDIKLSVLEFGKPSFFFKLQNKYLAWNMSRLVLHCVLSAELSTYNCSQRAAKLVKTMASYCVFGTIIKNESDQQLAYRVADWRYTTADGKAHPIKTKTEWVQEWKDQGVSFRWSILPDDQTFEPGDWSQEMAAM